MNQFQDINDKELAQKIKTGDKNAYQKLFEKYAPRIYNFAFSYLKNKHDAEELVQNVFLKIWEKRNLLDSSQNTKSFLFKVAVNTIYDFIRKKNLEYAFEDYALLNYSPGENFTWHSVIFEEMKHNLYQLVSQLPEQQQKIFHLSKLEGLSNEEIAQQLNLSKRTVENHLYRALAFLKSHFKAETLCALLFFHLLCG